MPKPIKKTPFWKGPDVDGITQSLLGRFLECRERFRLKVVEGLIEDEGFSRPLGFGNLWHAAEEARLGGHDWLQAVQKYRRKLDLRYPNDAAEVMKWYKVCAVTFPIYLEYWSKHKDESKAKPILEEISFAVPYTLPSGRSVLLRGKWDALRLLDLPKSKKQGIYIKEHKTKGEIDEEGILKTLGFNFQTMMYQIALRTWTQTFLSKAVFNERTYPSPEKATLLVKALQKGLLPAGVLYNVVRRPLADRYAIKQRKTESIDQFYQRLGQTIREDSFTKGKPKQKSNYFMRWKVEITDEDIEEFKLKTFHPILESLWDWWEWIRVDPFNPWNRTEDRMACANLSGHSPHFQAPWGVHNSLAGGFRGSYFELLTSGRDYGLIKSETLFPELA